MLSVTQLFHALSFVVLKIFIAKARNVMHTLTPALLTNISQELFSLCVIVLGNKAHETSASWNYTLLGYTPKAFWGITFGQNYTQRCRELHTELWGTNSNLISQSFRDKEYPQTLHDQVNQGMALPHCACHCWLVSSIEVFRLLMRRASTPKSTMNGRCPCLSKLVNRGQR